MKPRSIEAIIKSVTTFMGPLLLSVLILWLSEGAFAQSQMEPNFDLVDTAVLDPQNPSPALNESERLSRVGHDEVLSDPLDRVGEEFSVQPALHDRVAFWFDIYTRYGSAEHVLHHSLYPWIVFDVIDLRTEIANGKGPKWLRVVQAEKRVRARKVEIRTALRALSKNPSAKRATPLQKELIEKLSLLPGSRRVVYQVAAQALRSQLGQRDFFIQGLRRSSRYLPLMEETFLRAKLPVELTRMPFVESSFNEDAESKVGASGIWQIMPATGRAYVKVTPEIDERNSPLKATQVAATLLRSYNRALGNWPLAITSYNHGIGNIRSAMKAARSSDLAQIIQRYHRGDFQFASANFYTCFLAALYAEKYSEVVFPSVVRSPVLAHDKVRFLKPISLASLSSLTGLSFSEISSYNLDLRRRVLKRIRLPVGFVLLLPPGQALGIAEKLKGKIEVVTPMPLPSQANNF